MEVLRVEGLSKRYVLGKSKRARTGLRRSAPQRKAQREVIALDDLSFSLEAGTILGVIGPNGAGKSTLLKLLARITPPTAGRAMVRGRVVSLLELGAGFQPELTGRENVHLQAAFHDVPHAEVEGLIDEIAEFAELGDAIDRPVTSYSSGMHLRLAFATTINLRPDVLLADEALAVGDLEFQERCLRRVEEEGRAGTTVLFVSHDMETIERLCSRVLWLDRGVLRMDGTPEDVISAYEHDSWSRISETIDGARGTHINAHGSILGARLRSSSGAELGVARGDAEVVIEGRYRFVTPGMAVRCALRVECDGITVFRSIEPAAHRIDAPGIYLARATIPAHLLTDLVYKVKLGVEIECDDEQSSLGRPDALSFRVYCPDDATVPHGPVGGSTGGLVRPPIAWDFEPVRAGGPAGAATSSAPPVA